MTDWSKQTGEAKEWFESLRDRICAEFEAIEREAGSGASFQYTPWIREEAGNPDPGQVDHRYPAPAPHHPYRVSRSS